MKRTLVLLLLTGTLRAATIIDLGTDGALAGQANSINDKGRVAGWETRDITELGFIYQDGNIVTLSPGRAYQINNQNHVAGYKNVGDVNHATFWFDGHTIDLHPKDALYSAAFGLNEVDQIVGFALVFDSACSINCSPEPHAISWTNGASLDLNLLLPPNSSWQLQYAYSVNVHGAIVGQGLHEGVATAFLLIP